MGLIKALADAGTPMPFVMVMRQGNPKEITPSAIKAISPKTVVGERWYYEPQGIDWTQSDLSQVGAIHVRTYLARFPVDPKADFIYTLNEPMPGAGFASFWNAAMDEAFKQGHKIMVGNFPETWPAQPGDLDEHGQPKYLRDFWTWPAVHDVIRKIIAQGHALTYHTYIIPDPQGPWDHGYSMGREDTLLACLPADCQQVPIYLSETGTGWSQWYDSTVLVNGIHAEDTWLHQTKANVRGGALWVGADWIDNAHPKVNSNLAFHKDPLRAYWLTTRF